MDITQIILIIFVAALMLGLGASISIKDVKQTIKMWRPLLVGLLCQFGLMPLFAFLFSLALDAPAALGMAMILVGSSPGGSTSNLFSFWSRGDLPLSIAMTCVSTVAALGMMPLLSIIYLPYYTDGSVKFDYVNMVLALFLVLIPVAVGVAIKYKSDRVAKVLLVIANIVGALFVIAAIVVGSVTNSNIFSADWKHWVAAVFLLPVAAGLGYLLSWIFRQPHRISRTVALETGIQNATLTVTIITVTFPEGDMRDKVMTFPLLYALWIIIDGFLLTLLFFFLSRKEKEESQDAAKKTAEEGAEGKTQSLAEGKEGKEARSAVKSATGMEEDGKDGGAFPLDDLDVNAVAIEMNESGDTGRLEGGEEDGAGGKEGDQDEDVMNAASNPLAAEGGKA